MTARREAGVFYGWVVVAAAFTVLFLAYGLQFSYGVFATGISAELGWSRAQTALPYSLYVFAYSALSAATGRATDRFGPRKVIAIGAGLLALGWGASALVHEPWQLMLALGLVASLGMSVSWVPCNATVARWFTRRRGTAVSIASSGASLGNFLVPPLAAVMMAAWGWRTALGLVALASGLLMLIAARFMVRDPETMGLTPDGDATPLGGVVSDGLSLAEARGSASFALVVAMYFCTWLVVFVPFVHVPAQAVDLGFGAASAASLLSAIGLGGVAGRLSSGVISDRIGRCPGLLVVFALQAASFAGFALADTLPWLWCAALAFGFSYGGGVSLLPPLCGDLFGRVHMASIVGVIFAVAGAPAAFGPYLTGWLYDRSGSYGAAFLGAAALNGLAFALCLVLAAHMRRGGDAR